MRSRRRAIVAGEGRGNVRGLVRSCDPGGIHRAAEVRHREDTLAVRREGHRRIRGWETVGPGEHYMLAVRPKTTTMHRKSGALVRALLQLSAGACD